MPDPATSLRLAEQFFARVWNPPHDFDAIDELMTEDYRITTAGLVVEGRLAFKRWVGEMQAVVTSAANTHLDLFTDATGEKVVSRWVTRGEQRPVWPSCGPEGDRVQRARHLAGGRRSPGRMLGRARCL